MREHGGFFTFSLPARSNIRPQSRDIAVCSRDIAVRLEKINFFLYNTDMIMPLCRTETIIMKKTLKSAFVIFFALLFSASLYACGKKDAAEGGSAQTAEQPADTVFEVKITPENLYDYFDYKEYQTCYKDEDGNITSILTAYGFALKEGYTAANDGSHKDTMQVSFTAEGVLNTGAFSVDFSTLQYTGDVTGTETTTVSQTLKFWPKGNRTIIWNYGIYSDSYISYLQNFTVTDASGSVFLKKA